MATYRQPKWIGLGSVSQGSQPQGPLAYHFVSCSDEIAGCPPDNSLTADETAARLASCVAIPPGGDYVLTPSNDWVEGFLGVTVFPDFISGLYKVNPADICLDTQAFAPGFAYDYITPDYRPWIRCGRWDGISHGPFGSTWNLVDLDPAHPECICSENPTHCVGGEFAIPPTPLHWNTDDCWSINNQCISWMPGCPTPGDVFDAANGLCRNGAPDGHCPPGTTWDPICGTCVGVVPPHRCWVWRNCKWNPPGTVCTYPFVPDTRSCTCFCAVKACGPNSYVDPVTCECHTCPFGECYCVPQRRCVVCDDPPCKFDRRCVWNHLTCQWDCQPGPPGSSACLETEHFDLLKCRCVPNCDPGECWCEGTALCMACTPPACHVELNCQWDVDACDWVCDPPPCVAPATWDVTHCRCQGGENGPWNMELVYGKYHVASAQHGVRYRRAESTIPPFITDVAVTTSPAHTQPRMVRDWRQRTLLLYTDASVSPIRVLERISDDEGDTWSQPRTIFVSAKHPMPAGPQPYSGAVVCAAYSGGNIIATRQYPGDPVAGPQFTFKNAAGAALAVDDASFGLSPAYDGTLRWLLAVNISGTETHLQSTDDCATWTVVS